MICSGNDATYLLWQVVGDKMIERSEIDLAHNKTNKVIFGWGVNNAYDLHCEIGLCFSQMENTEV